MKYLCLLLSLVLPLATLSLAQDRVRHVHYPLPLRGSVEQSLHRSTDILQAMGPVWVTPWDHPPRCVHARFDTTAVDSIMVLICEGMSWEDNLTLGCTSIVTPAPDQLCEAIRHSYLHDS